jgi:hypothetical protein
LQNKGDSVYEFIAGITDSNDNFKIMKINKNLNTDKTAIVEDSTFSYGELPLNNIFNGSKTCLLHNYSVFYNIQSRKLVFHSIFGKQSVRVVETNEFTHFVDDPELICVKTLDFIALWGTTRDGSTRE